MVLVLEVKGSNPGRGAAKIRKNWIFYLRVDERFVGEFQLQEGIPTRRISEVNTITGEKEREREKERRRERGGREREREKSKLPTAIAVSVCRLRELIVLDLMVFEACRDNF